MSNYLLKWLASFKQALVSSREKQQMGAVNTHFFSHLYENHNLVITLLIGASNILLPSLLSLNHWSWSVIASSLALVGPAPPVYSIRLSWDWWVIRSAVINNMRLEIYQSHLSSFGPPMHLALRWLKLSEDRWKRTSISGIYVISPLSSRGGKKQACTSFLFITFRLNRHRPQQSWTHLSARAYSWV